MVRKKKSKSVSQRDDGPEVVDESTFAAVTYRKGTLKEKLAAEGIPFNTTMTDLLDLLRKEEILKNRDIRYFLICECLIITIFTTVSGPSLLDNSFEEVQDPPIPPVSRRALRRQWEINDYIFLKFLRFVMENRNCEFCIEDFKKPRHKFQLEFLSAGVADISSMVLDENYNLLYDYIRTIIVTILADWALVTLTVGDGIDNLKRIICSYGRQFETTGNYNFYSLIEHKDTSRKFKLDYYQRIQRHLLELDHRSSNEQYETLFDENKSPETSDPSNGINHQQISHDENVFSFDINQDGSLAIPNLISHIPLRHDLLSKTLSLHKIGSPLLIFQFRIICGLVDPLTQPLPNDKHVISIDFLYELFLGLMCPEISKTLQLDDGLDWKYHICFNMQKILKCSMQRLNFNDFEKLNSINNSDESVDWRKQLDIWLPHGFNPQNLELIYMIDILAVYSIYKLYDHLPIQLNPFLSTFISIWKNLTCVILLGLEIDRIEEEHETFETPVSVRAAIRGATALRAVIATVLNGHVESYKHDFKHESLNTFMSPYGRKLCQGALYADLKSHAGAILALGVDLKDVTELLTDLQAGDRFDEDVRYMFEYEYDDFHDVPNKDIDPDNEQPIDDADDTKSFRQRRCNCIFDDDEMEYEGDEESGFEEDVVQYEKYEGSKQDQYEPHIKLLSTGKPQAVRHPNSFEFDYSGKDWRDIPRELNFYYSEQYDFLEKPDLELIISLTLKATTIKLDGIESLLLLQSVASCVKNEHDESVLGGLLDPKYYRRSPRDKDNEDDKQVNVHRVQPDDIYDLWCLESTFEKMLQRNPHLAWRLMDEMLVCSGYRRVLIWFITHMKMNFALIEYIYELVMGLRGNPLTDASEIKGSSAERDVQPTETVRKAPATLPFSRQGSISLSFIETKMLMQEFFTNAAISLSERPKDSNEERAEEENSEVSLYDVELMKLICSMVRTFIAEEKFDFSETESAFELQALLMNWIAIVPEARSLFFELKSIMTEKNIESNNHPNLEFGEDSESLMNPEYSIDSNNEDFEYNRKLMNLLPLPIKENENNVETAAVQTLRDFIRRYPFNASIPTIGRKIIYEDDEILPLPKSDHSLSLHEYLLEFDEEYSSGDASAPPHTN